MSSYPSLQLDLSLKTFAEDLSIVREEDTKLRSSQALWLQPEAEVPSLHHSKSRFLLGSLMWETLNKHVGGLEICTLSSSGMTAATTLI